jgi:hypothetical protein
MADYVPAFPLGAGGWTSQASGAITGGQLLLVSGAGTVAPATLTALTVVGVAAHDAASGANLVVFPLKMIHETNAGTGGITAGNPLKSDANGLVTLWVSGTDSAAAFLGVALNTATAGNPVQWIGR